MASFKSNPVFYSILVVIGVIAVGEGWCIFDRSKAAKKSQAVLVQKRRELAALESVEPFPSEANKAAVEADLLRTQAALATMHEELKGRGPMAEELRNAKVPSEPTDIFFDITNFVEKTRAKAKEAEVKIKADERFGFSAYANAGPDRDLIPQVFRQRQVAQYLIESLFAAHPAEMVSFQRERPLTKAQIALIASGQPLPPVVRDGSGTDADLFEIDPRISARVPGFVSATAFRMTFLGETESLRTLLNKLAAFELPLVVRSVEVEPASGVTAVNAPAPSASEANSLSAIFGNVAATPASSTEPVKPKPLVEKVLSKFTVTVELIDLVPSTPSEATPTS
ncbi:MAG TPA: Amuc_1100 family pilus-like protein [Rariglobus sp.]|jgi:hypothetical protein|nr:Amuc_1100 family pilus-like protein [Rariglobus sp.]